mgnify:CR=1 FL=1
MANTDPAPTRIPSPLAISELVGLATPCSAGKAAETVHRPRDLKRWLGLIDGPPKFRKPLWLLNGSRRLEKEVGINRSAVTADSNAGSQQSCLTICISCGKDRLEIETLTFGKSGKLVS